MRTFSFTPGRIHWKPLCPPQPGPTAATALHLSLHRLHNPPARLGPGSRTATSPSSFATGFYYTMELYFDLTLENQTLKVWNAQLLRCASTHSFSPCSPRSRPPPRTTTFSSYATSYASTRTGRNDRGSLTRSVHG